MPRSSSQGRYPESSQLETTSLRHSSDSATSSSPVTARRAPQARLAAATVSPGRSRVFEGMQAQNEHSPATSSLSTIATLFMPPSASSPAQTSPAGPAPITIAS